MVIEELESIFNETLKELNIDEKSKIIKSNRPDLCDYQFDGCFKIASLTHKKPLEIGEQIVENIKNRTDFNDYFSSLEFVLPGFINITLSDKYINNVLKKINDSENFGIKKPEKKETFFLDYGGYNIAKPLHIGHLRPTIIGESIKRIIKFMGHNVICDVHLGDYGLQMGQVIYGILRDNIKIEEIDIDYLNKIYPEISSLCKSDEKIKEECALITKKLQDGDVYYKEIWDKILEVSIDDAKDICEFMDISFDLWQGESDAYLYLDEIEKILKEQNLLEISDGACVINVKKENDNKPMPPLMFKKSNGAYLYDSTDLATIYERKIKYNPDHIIYVTDFRQKLHFEQVFRASDLAHFMPYSSLEHTYNGTINGVDGKPFKTRNGDAPKLRELFEIVRNTFIEKKETNKNMSEQDINKIVNSILKFADLQNNREKDYIFDVSKFSEVVGKTGPYILYTYIRIQKIINNENKNLYDKIYNKYDRDLRMKIIEFDQEINKSFNERMPNYIADYVYNLCVVLNTFYQNNYLANLNDYEKKESWVYILHLANRILKEMLNLLIIDIPTVM